MWHGDAATHPDTLDYRFIHGVVLPVHSNVDYKSTHLASSMFLNHQDHLCSDYINPSKLVIHFPQLSRLIRVKRAIFVVDNNGINSVVLSSSTCRPWRHRYRSKTTTSRVRVV